MSLLNFKDVLLITASPIVGDVVGQLGEISSHYICLDDFTEFEGAVKLIAEQEHVLLKKIDSCFAVSEVLMKTRTPKNGQVYHLPQGIQTSHFLGSPGPIPIAFRNYKKPIVGYFGILASYIDYTVIVETAKRMSDVTFIYLGRTTLDIEFLNKIPNINYLGESPYQYLPQHAQIFDVGFIPFLVNDLTIAANPLKLLEYFALGLPVVSSDLPEVRKFEPMVRIYNDVDSCVRCISLALAGKF